MDCGGGAAAEAPAGVQLPLRVSLVREFPCFLVHGDEPRCAGGGGGGGGGDDGSCCRVAEVGDELAVANCSSRALVRLPRGVGNVGHCEAGRRAGASTKRENSLGFVTGLAPEPSGNCRGWSVEHSRGVRAHVSLRKMVTAPRVARKRSGRCSCPVLVQGNAVGRVFYTPRGAWTNSWSSLGRWLWLLLLRSAQLLRCLSSTRGFFRVFNPARRTND